MMGQTLNRPVLVQGFHDFNSADAVITISVGDPVKMVDAEGNACYGTVQSEQWVSGRYVFHVELEPRSFIPAPGKLLHPTGDDGDDGVPDVHDDPSWSAESAARFGVDPAEAVEEHSAVSETDCSCGFKGATARALAAHLRYYKP